jgi:hypothetical protein
MPDDAKTFRIDDAKIIFRNFAGKEGQYNREGDRNFSVILDPIIAKEMLADGWNVKFLAPREEGEEETPYISVTVNFKNRPPRVVMITSSGRTNLSEESVEVLDWADIAVADLLCRGYDWEVNGKSGTKAYLKTLFVTVEEDELEQKYGYGDLESHGD